MRAASTWTVLATYLRPQWTRTVWLACLVVATIGLQVANPQLLRLFIDTATQQASLEPLIGIAILFLAVAVTTQLLSIAETYVDGDVTTLANFFSRFVVYVVGNGLLLGGVLVLLFILDWRIGLPLGRIGSGKTTLVRVLLGLLPLQSGMLRWNQQPIADPGSVFIPPSFTPRCWSAMSPAGGRTGYAR